MQQAIRFIDQAPDRQPKVYDYLKETKNEIQDLITFTILEKVTTDLLVEGSFNFRTVLKDHGHDDVSKHNPAYNVFHSSYLKEMLTNVKCDLKSRGYNSEIAVDNNTIDYKVRVINIRTWMLKRGLALIFFSGISSYAASYLNTVSDN